MPGNKWRIKHRLHFEEFWVKFKNQPFLNRDLWLGHFPILWFVAKIRYAGSVSQLFVFFFCDKSGQKVLNTSNIVT